ncbi:MAG: hypothetical protein A3F31_01570 [Candidatus Levybacteria bacterium RIFCSPHIGHO2_12_FULL_38_12]|nr:MAG: hypothetical protein A2770_01190 [Candidatus Levybacteria bacterium RIFCSPHIGHO2_01_FULL_38_12]OGH22898.1 MAG: hypothetical protein A3F31_01570 [Candidatus Levybacteria bacterium RIFCSPHIGHO2_12_FULL_38_12]OGH34014.1 MAG: hypothetical protein A3A47_04810 [Candidatus Levybacteria bacterium RIFCSPLOWO2_01_FULL_37_20]OGH44822.1 MAG: hypothetical protein A3J14_05345 [Candidatus Levybacteria bacterium RIFCSPLOWO2_02_FULL_37_18]
MIRKVVFATNEIYHIFNRGVEKRPIFEIKNDYLRFLDLINYYRFANCPIRFSHFKRLNIEEKQKMFNYLITESDQLVEIYTHCLMPNHFHFLLKQVKEKGISKFVSKILNGYSHYFNIRHKRIGHLFQGNFGAVRIEDGEQFLHVHRYIHLNPVTAYLLKFENLEKYKYSSYTEYLGKEQGFCNTSAILSNFKKVKDYVAFIRDQVDYARQLDKIKHLLLE